MEYTVYLLADPRDQAPRYVGLSRDPIMRYQSHLRGDGINWRKSKWIRELIGLGLQPLLQEIEVVQGTEAEAKEREVYWIRSLIERGASLLNIRGAREEALPQTVRLPVSLRKWLRIRAAMEGRDISDLVTQALEEYRAEVEG